jgi:hypothetical protein
VGSFFQGATDAAEIGAGIGAPTSFAGALVYRWREDLSIEVLTWAVLIGTAGGLIGGLFGIVFFGFANLD